MAVRTHDFERTLRRLVELLRCPECGSQVVISSLVQPGAYPELGPDGMLECLGCDEQYPLVAGTVRMLRRERRTPRPNGDLKARTVASFTYEWQHFGAPREEWRKNFLDYMQPHDAEWFAGKRVLDVGTGSGRHSREAAMLGSEVVAVDLGRAIDVARRNLPDTVATVQADADDLPFAEGVFDMVMSIGVLHHLPEPERTLRRIVRHARPDGAIQIYLYWVPQLPGHQRVLSLVTAARVVTTRLPHRLLHALCYPLAAGLYLTCVLPYRHGRRRPRLAPLVDALPLKAYADYPFAVCLNDQFDRLSAPIERRYTDAEVAEMLRSAGLEAVRVLPNTGWIGSARRDSVAEALT